MNMIFCNSGKKNKRKMQKNDSNIKVTRDFLAAQEFESFLLIFLSFLYSFVNFSFHTLQNIFFFVQNLL